MIELEFYKNGYEEYKNEYLKVSRRVSMFDVYKKEIYNLLQELTHRTRDKIFLTKKNKEKIEKITKRLLYIYKCRIYNE